MTNLIPRGYAIRQQSRWLFPDNLCLAALKVGTRVSKWGNLKNALFVLISLAVFSSCAFAGDDVNVPAAATAAHPSMVEAPTPAITTAAQPVVIETPRRHNFFDVKNSLALTSLGIGLTADALSTQKGLGYPRFSEMNPIARPFVKTRGGAAVYSAASFALLGCGMYLAHKTNHHKIERITPFVLAGWEGFLAARNYHLVAKAAATAR